MHKVTAAKAKQLWDTWATIGFTSEQRYHRMETVEHHVDNLLTRMVEEEVVLKEKLESDVEGFRSELVGLSMDLNVQNYTVSFRAVLRDNTDRKATMYCLASPV